MSDLFADRLLSAIAKKGSPICVGIDPMYEMLPDAVLTSPRDADDAEAAIDGIFKFTTEVLKIVAPHVPVVKFQSAYFEKYLWEGVEAYYSLVQEAKSLGLRKGYVHPLRSDLLPPGFHGYQVTRDGEVVDE